MYETEDMMVLFALYETREPELCPGFSVQRISTGLRAVEGHIPF